MGRKLADAELELKAEREARRSNSAALREWHTFIADVAKQLKCFSDTDTVLAAIRKMKAEHREMRRLLRGVTNNRGRCYIPNDIPGLFDWDANVYKLEQKIRKRV